MSKDKSLVGMSFDQLLEENNAIIVKDLLDGRLMTGVYIVMERTLKWREANPFWDKNTYGYSDLFNAISGVVKIEGEAISVSVKTFEEAMIKLNK